ncbi:hypothetical protein [Paenibacillus flagellatus]|uniref:hypothetical protein n=1 Tax=Paenibacillus flagellatus TaxID=2211139 RepID=UPI001B879362|nr:hypothetical protein [Paenibacillus flagellatus]
MQDKKKLYILLTDTGTLLTRTIKAYTKEPYNHASIAFDAELRDVYSFGRKCESNPFRGGFVKETIRGPLFLNEDHDTTCALYVCEVGKAAYDRIRRTVREMQKREDDYKYNLLGLFGVMLNVRLKRKNAYFCSQFVSEVALTGGVSLVDKCPELTTPGDLGRSALLRPVYSGSLKEYPPLRRWLDGECAAAALPERIPG